MTETKDRFIEKTIEAGLKKEIKTPFQIRINKHVFKNKGTNRSDDTIYWAHPRTEIKGVPLPSKNSHQPLSRRRNFLNHQIAALVREGEAGKNHDRQGRECQRRSEKNSESTPNNTKTPIRTAAAKRRHYKRATLRARRRSPSDKDCLRNTGV